MKKRLITLLGITVLTLSTLTACGGSEETTEPKANKQQEKVDEVAPVISFANVDTIKNSGYLWTNTLDLDVDSILSTVDSSDVTVDYEIAFLGAAEEATEEVIASYLTAEESAEVAAENAAEHIDGFYRATFTAKDEAENASTATILVLYDTAAPSISKSGDEIVVWDDFAGALPEACYTVTESDNSTLVSASDYAGNTAEESFDKVTETANVGGGNSNSNEGSSNGGSYSGKTGETSRGSDEWAGVSIANDGSYIRFASGAVYYGENIRWNQWGGVNYDCLCPLAEDRSWRLMESGYLGASLEEKLQIVATAIGFADWGTMVDERDNYAVIFTKDIEDLSYYIQRYAERGYFVDDFHWAGSRGGIPTEHNGDYYYFVPVGWTSGHDVDGNPIDYIPDDGVIPYYF